MRPVIARRTLISIVTAEEYVDIYVDNKFSCASVDVDKMENLKNNELLSGENRQCRCRRCCVVKRNDD